MRMRSDRYRFSGLDQLPAVRTKLGLRNIARWSVRGLGAGAALSVLLLALHRAGLPFPTILPLVLPLVGLLLGSIVGARAWPTILEAARTVDFHFGLHDRLTTALQLEGSGSVLHILQREDTGQSIQGLHLTSSVRIGPPLREALGMLAGIAVVIALFLVPTPASRISPVLGVSPRATLPPAAIVRVPSLAKASTRGLTAGERNSPAVRALTLALTRLQHELQTKPGRHDALRAISATQQQLQRISSSLHPISAVSATQLEQSLHSQMTRAERQQSLKPQGKNSVAASAKFLNRLARAIARMKPRQRAQLAGALARAANGNSAKALRSSLRKASSSLGNSNPGAAIKALRSAASALQRSFGQQAAQSKLGGALSALNSAKGAVAGLNKGRQSGTTTGKGSGARSGRAGGSGSGKASGSNGSHGSASGKRRLRGQSSGRSKSHGGGSGGNGRAGKGKGQFRRARVVPQSQRSGKGPHTILTGPKGLPLPGVRVPYQVVLRRYATTARTALDRSSLPPDLQAYVRQYFSTISH
ncbi:MAG: hypothetical protein ACRDFX_01950 [Chloroflexota bacterium]